jgi:transcriptional regulator with PAS, ATPase and Fis domain
MLVSNVSSETGIDGSAEEIELAEVVARAERKAILAALAAEDDNKIEAAKRLGIGERTLWTKLKKYGL